jgi:fructoselysine 6-phosphate deglycase
MIPPFDAEDYRRSLAGARAALAPAEALGRALMRNRRRLYFVGCGASNRIAAIVHDWAERSAKSLDLRRFYPAEFMVRELPTLDATTLVVFSSKSGATTETVAAARWAKERGLPCATVAVTESPDSPLARACDHALTFGTTEQAYYATYMTLQAFVAGCLDASEGCHMHGALMRGLDALPDALIETIAASETRNEEHARLYRDDRQFLVVGSGPCYSTAYVFGICIMMEMQWLQAQPIEGAEFFHGPFEIVDAAWPLLLLVGEDPTRPLAERVVRFARKVTPRTMVYDTRDFALAGIAPELRGVFSPLVLQCALTRLAARFAALHGHPLSTRRYMGKVEY